MTFKKSVLQCTSIALLMALICGLVFSCPVFAADSYSGQPLEAGSFIGIGSSGYERNVRQTLLSFSDPVYLYFYQSSPTSNYELYFLSESRATVVVQGSSNNTVNVTTTSYISSYNLYSQYYGYGILYNSEVNSSIPVFSNRDDAVSACRDYIDNGGSSSGDLITASSYFGVPAGYAAFIELPTSSTDWDITVTQEFDDYSSLFGGQWSPLTSLWGFQSSLPSGSGNFSKSGLTVIPMYKMKPYTVLGQSKTGFSNKSTMVANGFWSNTPSSKYLVIYNPVIRAVSGTVGGASIADNVYVYNKGISVTMSGYYSPVKYYKLESTVTTSGLESSPADGTFEDSEYTETFDSEGNSQGIVNSNGDSSTLNDGGGDLIPSATSIGDYVRNLNQTLNKFASNFIDLMTSPISHVQQLINAGTNYFNVIQGLYGWLPDEVHAVVKSGMVVALSIGVISVLL